jgi:tripartite-type tricarboxylate transporter receptor subunit TctC
MRLLRRQFLQLGGIAAALPVLPGSAFAETYPSRPVHLLVGFAAGGVVDIGARLIADRLSQRLGQPFIVDDRPGAGSNLAAEAVVRAVPDGYTLLEGSSSNCWNTAIYDNLTFDFLKDTTPVASILRSVGIMEINPDLPVKTIPEFIAYAKANPGKINMATAGPGSGPHLYGELFKRMTGVDLLTVHYRGAGPALPDLISGRVQVMFDIIVSSIEYIRAGKLRPLGVTTAARLDVLPDVPSIGDFVPGYEGIGWNGIVAPKATSPEIVSRLNAEVNAILAEPAFKAKLADLGAETFPSSPSEFAEYLDGFTEKWAKVIRAANIKAD